MSKYGNNSSFLRSSAVYGSGHQTPFGELVGSRSRVVVDRSAVGGVSTMDSNYNSSRQQQQYGGSNTNSPMRRHSATPTRNNNATMDTETNSRNYGNFDHRSAAANTMSSSFATNGNSPSRVKVNPTTSAMFSNSNGVVHRQHPSVLFNQTNISSSAYGGNSNANSPARPSSRLQAPPNTANRQQYNEQQQSPVGSRRGTPERARSPNPITGEYTTAGGGGNTPTRQRQQQQYNNTSYGGGGPSGNPYNRTASPSKPQSSHAGGGGTNYSAVRFAAPNNNSNANNQHSSYCIGGDSAAQSRNNSAPASRTSSIGRSSSVDSYNMGGAGGGSYQNNNNNYTTSNISQYHNQGHTNNGAPNHNDDQLNTNASASSQQPIKRVVSIQGGGGRGRANTPPRRAESPLAFSGEYNNNSASRLRTASGNSHMMRPAGIVERTASGVKRVPSTYSQTNGTFHISKCGPLNDDREDDVGVVGSSSSRRRAGGASPRRTDPTTMPVPAGVRTVRERFDECPFKVPAKVIPRKALTKNFGGADCGECIFGSGGANGGASSIQRGGSSEAGGGSDYYAASNADGTPSRPRTPTNGATDRPGRRRIDPPQREEKIGLWVRTKNKDDVVHLGVRGKGLPPPDGKVDETFTLTRKVIPQQHNIEAAACRVVGEEQKHVRARYNPIPNPPYHGFVVPPFRVDKDEVQRVAPDLEPEIYMEPFGKEYTHRRHFDPIDSVKEDIAHANMDGSITKDSMPNRVRGTALVAGKGPMEPSRNVLTLANYTAEELAEPQLRHPYRAGPPAFTPEEIKPYAANVSYKPHRSGCYNSPNHDSSGIDFGTTASAHRAATNMMRGSPMRTDSPRGPKFGTYSPARNVTRPY